ncbi:putative glucarate transporter [Planctomycetes bacterium Pan216]|uniref:Lysosomal dipeptide transporter MFSD1 n=1 Tax=Kolteria novifilia TaxID=2527975 RepID=A0A518B800_9BACT|nr:putative glucarate transporter [Planctomycetes bacterium Pan216]
MASSLESADVDVSNLEDHPSHSQHSSHQRYMLLSWVVFAFAVTFYSYEYFLRVSPSVMVEQLETTFNVKAAELGNLSAYYFYAYAAMQIPVGLMMDRFGARRLLTMATLICALGSLVFGYTSSVGVAEFSRVMMGFGSAFAFVGTIFLASNWFPPKRIALLSGMTTMVGMFGAISGEAALAELVGEIGWRASMYSWAALGLLLGFLVFCFVRDSPPKGHPARKPHHDHARSAMKLGDLMKNLGTVLTVPQNWLAAAYGGFKLMPTLAFAGLWAVPFFQATFGVEKTAAAEATSMVYVGWAVGGPSLGLLSDYIQRRRMLMIVTSFLATIDILVVLYVPGIPFVAMYLLMFLFGVFSAGQVLVFAVICDINPGKRAGAAIGFANMVSNLGGAFFQPIIGILLEMNGTAIDEGGGAVYAPSDFQFALSVLPIAMGLAFLVSLLIRESYGNRAPDAQTVAH